MNTLLEKYKTKQKYYKIKSLIQKYENLNNLISQEQLKEFEIEYMTKHCNVIYRHWRNIFQYQKLSEEFIEKMQEIEPGSVDWGMISQYQKLSYKFVKVYKDKISIHYLMKNKNVSLFTKIYFYFIG